MDIFSSNLTINSMDFAIRQEVFTKGDQGWLAWQAPLVELYKSVFSEEPYCENFDGREQSEIIAPFTEFAEHGVVVLAFAAGAGGLSSRESLIGFAGCIPAGKSGVAEFLSAHSDKLPPGRTIDSYMYMAELGIVRQFRGNGLGRKLIAARARETMNNPALQQPYLLVRTAKNNSNSWPIYQKLGATVISRLTQHIEGCASDSSERIYFELPTAVFDIESTRG